MTTADLCRSAIAVRRRQPIEYSTTGAAPTSGAPDSAICWLADVALVPERAAASMSF
jgi:hypothetical protein